MNFYNTIIIGAGTAGLTAAIYTARKNQTVLVLEESGIGGQISLSNAVENYPGFESISGAEFSDKLYEQALTLGVEIKLEAVTKIAVGENGEKLVYSEDDAVVRVCDKIIIATGRRHKKLNLQNEDRFAGLGINYCAVCDGAFYKHGTVAVAGGGNAAFQSVKFLSGMCKMVYLIHRRDTFKAEKRLVEDVRTTPNVSFILNHDIEMINGTDEFTGVTLRGASGEILELPLNGLFVAVGHIPNTEIFRDIVKMDENGYIIAAEDCKTNIDGIFAAGDCRTKQIRQLTTAAADGTVCALAD